MLRRNSLESVDIPDLVEVNIDRKSASTRFSTWFLVFFPLNRWILQCFTTSVRRSRRAALFWQKACKIWSPRVELNPLGWMTLRDVQNWLYVIYPLVICYIAIKHGDLYIVDLPIEHGGSFHSYVAVYQRLWWVGQFFCKTGFNRKSSTVCKNMAVFFKDNYLYLPMKLCFSLTGSNVK